MPNVRSYQQLPTLDGKRSENNLDPNKYSPEQIQQASKKERHQWFKAAKREGWIPEKYKSMEQFEAEWFELKQAGQTDAEVRQRLGVEGNRTPLMGDQMFTSKGKGPKEGQLNKRALRMSPDPESLRLMRESEVLKKMFGDGWLDDYARYVRLMWGKNKAKRDRKTGKIIGPDKEILEKFTGQDAELWTSLKSEALDLKDRLTRLLGKGGKASEVDMGHPESAMGGSGAPHKGIMPEHGMLNRAHGSTIRYLRTISRDLDLPESAIAALYEQTLTAEGKTLAPTKFSGLYVSVDESIREMAEGLNVHNPNVVTPSQGTVWNENMMEILELHANDSHRQLTAEYIRSGMTETDAIIAAKKTVNNYLFSKSTLFDVTPSWGNAVRQVREGVKTQVANVIDTVTGNSRKHVMNAWDIKNNLNQVGVWGVSAVVMDQEAMQALAEGDVYRAATTFAAGEVAGRVTGKVIQGGVKAISAASPAAGAKVGAALGTAAKLAVPAAIAYETLKARPTADGTLEAGLLSVTESEARKKERAAKEAADIKRNQERMQIRMDRNKQRTTPGSLKIDTPQASREARDWFESAADALGF